MTSPDQSVSVSVETFRVHSLFMVSQERNLSYPYITARWRFFCICIWMATSLPLLFEKKRGQINVLSVLVEISQSGFVTICMSCSVFMTRNFRHMCEQMFIYIRSVRKSSFYKHHSKSFMFSWMSDCERICLTPASHKCLDQRAFYSSTFARHST